MGVVCAEMNWSIPMTPRWHITASLALSLTAISSAASAADLLTIEQAEARSKATGRPILAMAGTKT